MACRNRYRELGRSPRARKMPMFPVQHMVREHFCVAFAANSRNIRHEPVITRGTIPTRLPNWLQQVPIGALSPAQILLSQTASVLLTGKPLDGSFGST
jgi:hypothetical protein